MRNLIAHFRLKKKTVHPKKENPNFFPPLKHFRNVEQTSLVKCGIFKISQDFELGVVEFAKWKVGLQQKIFPQSEELLLYHSYIPSYLHIGCLSPLLAVLRNGLSLVHFLGWGRGLRSGKSNEVEVQMLKTCDLGSRNQVGIEKPVLSVSPSPYYGDIASCLRLILCCWEVTSIWRNGRGVCKLTPDTRVIKKYELSSRIIRKVEGRLRFNWHPFLRLGCVSILPTVYQLLHASWHYPSDAKPSAFGAVLHVISTSILGITAITITNTIAGEESVHKLASLLLIVLGGSYIILFLCGKGGHSHSHNQPMEKMAVAGLVLVPALSPCATTLPVFLAVGNSSSMMVLAIIVLLFSTITVMTSLVALSFYGASQLKFHWVECYDKLLVGSVLSLVGILTLIFHDHDHEGGSAGGHAAFCPKSETLREFGLFRFKSGYLTPDGKPKKGPTRGSIVVHAMTGTYGINYGKISDNIPAPEDVLRLLRMNKIKNIRIYDADSRVLRAFSGSGIEISVCLPDKLLKDVSQNGSIALEWIQVNLQPYLPGTSIRGIAVGNEILGGDTSISEALVPAVRSVYRALRRLGLTNTIEVSTPHSEAIFSSTYPPSNGIVDPKTKLHYDNMFDAMVDATYVALEKLGYTKMQVIVSETGWASKGDDNEPGADPKNARTYNFNLHKRLMKKKGTPYRPKMMAKGYVFALFNENLKPGPTSERNFGLFKADGSIAYDIGFKGLVSSASSKCKIRKLQIIALFLTNPEQGWI
uniref:Glycosyl hydrolases family 17 protein n=1 Tax=Solanum demissum TaxID=50514 RepID=Q0KIW0_SOLDE|nr:Glycosyl hydrolases family 17 protein [Solanum demissum]